MWINFFFSQCLAVGWSLRAGLYFRSEPLKKLSKCKNNRRQLLTFQTFLIEISKKWDKFRKLFTVFKLKAAPSGPVFQVYSSTLPKGRAELKFRQHAEKCFCIQGDQLKMAVFFWYLEKVFFPVYTCTVASTGQVIFYKVPENTAMFIW